MAEEKILPEGLRFFNKHANAPDFVVGELIITLDDLHAFAKANPQLITDYQGKKQLKIQMLNSQAGKLYGVVNTYKATTHATKPATDIGPIDQLPF